MIGDANSDVVGDSDTVLTRLDGSGGSRYKLLLSGGPEVGPGPDYIAYVNIYFSIVALFINCTN